MTENLIEKRMTILHFDIFNETDTIKDLVWNESKGKMSLIRRLAITGLTIKWVKKNGEPDRNRIYTVTYKLPKRIRLTSKGILNIQPGLGLI